MKFNKCHDAHASVSVVIPTIRNLEFLKEWEPQFKENSNVELVIVEDHKEPTIKVPQWDNITVYSQSAIKNELKKHAWIIPTQSDGIRSYGFLKAKGDIIISLDDDCYPIHSNFVQNHTFALKGGFSSNFYPVFKNNYTIQPRGYPYGIKKRKKCMLNLGLWLGTPDCDSPTELVLKPESLKPDDFNQGYVPTGLLVPISIMNVAFRRDILPAYYQLPSGPYQRFHDIWSGFIIKRILDHLGHCMHVGGVFINHKKKSNIFTNLVKEAKGIQINEIMWKIIKGCRFQGTTYANCYNDMAHHFYSTALEYQEANYIDEFVEYLFKCSRAMKIWLKLYEVKDE